MLASTQFVRLPLIIIAIGHVVFAVTALGADDWLNVKTQYGAVGNGVANDTPAIQNAINDAANVTKYPHGAVVYFPAGTYLVSSTLTTGATTQPVSFLGDGIHSIIQRASAFTTGDTLVIEGSDDGGGRMVHPYVEKLTFQALVTPQSGSAIRLQDTEQAFLQEVRIGTTFVGGVKSTLGPYIGVTVAGGVNTHITHCYICNAAAIAVDILRDPAGGAPLGTFIDDCLFEGAPNMDGNITQVGIQIEDGASDVYVANCDLTQGSRGVYVKHGSGAIPQSLFFTHVLCDTNQNEGWRFENCKVVHLTSCWGASSKSSSGIVITAGTDFRIVDCTAIHNHQNGMIISGGTEIVVDGGVFGSNITSGIDIESSIVNFSIIGIRAGVNSSAWVGTAQGFGIHVKTGCNNYVIQEARTPGNGTAGLRLDSGQGGNTSVTGNVPGPG